VKKKNKDESLAVCRVLEPSGQDSNRDVSKDAHNIENCKTVKFLTRKIDKENVRRKVQAFENIIGFRQLAFPGSREGTARVTHMVQTRGIKKKSIHPSWLPRKNVIDITAIYNFLCVNDVQSYSIRTVKPQKEPVPAPPPVLPPT